MIEARAVSKRYGTIQAVDGVSFTVRKGEAFGLLGPNGAGKTTTIHMLVGVLVPDAGGVAIGGLQDPTRPEVRRQIGIAPQGLAIYDELTGEENLAMFGSLYGMSGAKLRERVDWSLEFAGLTERRKHRASAYSGGMKRRLNLACALVHEPALLVCDEPTVGVDPQSRNHVFESIEALRAAGTTLLYTTHYMEEAQRLCDRVAIMDHGRILAEGSVEALIEQHGGSSLVQAELAAPPAPGVSLPGTLMGTTLRIDTDKPFELVATLGRADVEVQQLRVDRPDLERVFLKLTGRLLRDA
jgi:ABC-2 type transport system ATP-binding protein